MVWKRLPLLAVITVVLTLACFDFGSNPDDGEDGSDAAAPSSPPTFSVTQGEFCDGVLIVWTQTHGAKHINVYKSATATGQYQYYSKHTTALATSTFDTGYSAQDTFYYKLTSDNGGVETEMTAYQMGFVSSSANSRSGGTCGNQNGGTGGGDGVVPSTPTGFAVSKGSVDRAIEIKWNAVYDNADYYQYKIYKSRTSGGAVIDTLWAYVTRDNSVLTLTKTDYDVTPGDTFYYTIAEVDEDGESAPTSVDWGYPGLVEGWAGLPHTPASVSASMGALLDSVQLYWSWWSGDTVDHINIYRSSSSTDTNYTVFTFVGDPAVPVYFVDTNVTPGDTMWYRVSAVNSVGESPFSKAVAGYALGPGTPPPNYQLTAAITDTGAITATSITVIVSASAGTAASNYGDTFTVSVLSANALTGPFHLLATVDSGSVVDSNLTPLTTYYYKVVGYSNLFEVYGDTTAAVEITTLEDL